MMVIVTSCLDHLIGENTDIEPSGRIDSGTRVRFAFAPIRIMFGVELNVSRDRDIAQVVDRQIIGVELVCAVNDKRFFAQPFGNSGMDLIEPPSVFLKRFEI